MASISLEGSLADILTAEHRILDGLWDEARGSLEGGAAGNRDARLATFVRELHQHIQDEEEVLFPAFEEHTGMKNGGPTTVMRMEHRQMEALLEKLTQALAGEDSSATFAEHAAKFSGLLDSHDKKEEGMLYPMMDRAFAESERSGLLKRTSLGSRDS